jgi:hypothetical protein
MIKPIAVRRVAPAGWGSEVGALGSNGSTMVSLSLDRLARPTEIGQVVRPSEGQEGGFEHIVGEFVNQNKKIIALGAVAMRDPSLLAVALHCIRNGISAGSTLDWHYARKSYFRIRN